MKHLIWPLLAGLFFIGCVNQPSPKLKGISFGSYEEVSYTSIPAWTDEDFSEVLDLFLKTCEKTASKALYTKSCKEAKAFERAGADAKLFFEMHFTPFRSLSKRSLATGYYEPFLDGSLVETEEFSYPVYGVPDDLLKIELSKTYQKSLDNPIRGRMSEGVIKPYFTRKEINANALSSQEPICYVNDNVDLFFLQVQGSGCIRLRDGTLLYLGYADQNGHPYVSIGTEMIKKGMIQKEDISLKSIASYFEEYPYQTQKILNLNPSYVFFEPRTHSASGSLGIVLKAGRSVAVDEDNIPLGMPLFISTTDPISEERYEKMVFAHDTGGAIKGEARLDLFFGSGPKAGEKAGHMKAEVTLWMLVPNDYLSKQAVK